MKYQDKNRIYSWQIKENENNKKIFMKNKIKIDVDKKELSNIKSNNFYLKTDKEGSSMKNIKNNKRKNDTIENNDKSNNYSKYIYSFSVEKKSPNEIKVKTGSQIERKKNDNNNIINKNNELKEKEQKNNNYDIKSNQIISGNNNNFLTICTKKEINSNKENKINTNDKIRKEINIGKINNNLLSADKKNYAYTTTINMTKLKEDEKNKNNDSSEKLKENTIKLQII